MRSLPVLFLVLSLKLISQNRVIDSLENLIRNAPSRDEAAYEKAVLAFKYYTAGRAAESHDLMDEAITDAGRNGSAKTLGAIHNTWGTIHFYEGRVDSALAHYQISIGHRLEAKDQIGAIKTTGNVGNIYLAMGKLEKAQEYFEKALKLEAAAGFAEGTYTSLTNLASIFRDLHMPDKAIKLYRKAASAAIEKKTLSSLSTTYDGMATVYRDIQKYDSALFYAKKALIIARQIGEPGGEGYALVNIAMTYNDMRRLEEGRKALREAMPLAAQAADQRLLVGLYGNLVANFVLDGNNDSAMKYMEVVIPLFDRLGQKMLQPDMLKLTAEYHFRKKDFASGYEAMKMYSMVQDSIFKNQMLAKAAELQEKYETDKKEKENQLLQSENKRQRSSRNFLAIILALALLLLAGAIFAFARIRKAKRVISVQKTLVEEKQKEIMDSINYARRIQYALLASDQLLKKHLPEHFVLFRPKAVVSGDFYWASPTDDGFAVVTGDCTGHGVPGAFMSLLNITKLSQVINEQKVTRPDQVFNKVREEIVKALNPEEGSTQETKDGMDAVLCKFKRGDLSMEYAAANNSVYIVRRKELIICKADKMPVGKGQEHLSFSYNEVHLEKGDMVYMFTDGFADQFGGPLGKKFKYKQFEHLLITISAESTDRQKSMLEQAFDRWRGSLEQVDDVCVVGIRI